MEDSIKISVIIPVYSVERYLRECIDSVRYQTYKNIEIILVDDGSPDSSPMICELYAKEDNRIVVIHKENGGAADARNHGIATATGEYVAFLDGDDYWDDVFAIERLVARVRETHPDVLNFSYKKYYDDTKEKIPYFKKVVEMPQDLKSKKEQLEYLSLNQLYIASSCNKLISRKLFDENLKFERDNLSEDVEWCSRLLYYAESMDFVYENFYCYRQRKESTRHTIDDKKCMDLSKNIIRCIEISQQAEKELQKFYYQYAAYQYGTFFKVQAQVARKQTECIEMLEDYVWVLNYHNQNKKLKYLNIGCRILGYKNLCDVVRFLYRKKYRGA